MYSSPDPTTANGISNSLDIFKALKKFKLDPEFQILGSGEFSIAASIA